MGNGLSDSEIDVLMYSGDPSICEMLMNTHCKLTNPLIDSHHDLLVSSFPSLPASRQPGNEEGLVSAPRLENERVRVRWEEEGIEAYEELLGNSPQELRDRWTSQPSLNSFSVLLASTNIILSSAATETNKYTRLADEVKKKSRRHPDIKIAQKKLTSAQHSFTLACDDEERKLAGEAKAAARLDYRKAIRREQQQDCDKRDTQMHQILSSNPSKVFSSIQSLRTNKASINTLKVGDKTYIEEKVPDGFFDSLSSLKSPNMSEIEDTQEFKGTQSDFDNIIKICSEGKKIKPITPQQSMKILFKVKPEVSDLYSITPNHYIHAGPAGHAHFHHLLSMLVTDINLSTIKEVNSVFAKLLYKGHNKDKTSYRSWRTISNCPVLAKALDTHIGDLYSASWQESQAETQFQGAGRSHTLAALLLTETILISAHHHKQPLYCLFLDAKSCYDKILYQSVVREAFVAGTQDQGLIFIKIRLENRQTYCEYSKTMMGPIQDKLGVEQGGKNSDSYFRLCGNNQLETAQRSGLGSSLLEGLHVAAIGQADDTCLLSSSIHKLRSLVNLNKNYCKKFHVQLVPEKQDCCPFAPAHTKTMTYTTEQ